MAASRSDSDTLALHFQEKAREKQYSVRSVAPTKGLRDGFPQYIVYRRKPFDATVRDFKGRLLMKDETHFNTILNWPMTREVPPLMDDTTNKWISPAPPNRSEIAFGTSTRKRNGGLGLPVEPWFRYNSYFHLSGEPLVWLTRYVSFRGQWNCMVIEKHMRHLNSSCMHCKTSSGGIARAFDSSTPNHRQ